MKNPKTPLFITGNQHKADYLSKMLGIDLAHKKIDLEEIQSTSLEEIVSYKAKQAYAQVRKPVLVEDVGLYFKALDGLPGPFIKFFVEADNGLENICRMLDGFDDRSAEARCVFGYYDGETCTLIAGGMAGVIAQHPRGGNGYGFDKVFEPTGFDGKTRAELNPEDDELTYTQIKPFEQLREFLSNEK